MDGDYDEAAATFFRENFCPKRLKVEKVVEGSFVTEDYRDDRVRLWVDKLTEMTMHSQSSEASITGNS